MFTEPIRTIQQAKEFFQAMGCSHFHMDRDYPERAGEYDSLEISLEIETGWIQEQFDEYYNLIMKNEDTSRLWNLHSRMYDLFCELETRAELTKMLDVTREIREKAPVFDRVIIAETINGRRVREARSGLIYAAYDLGDIEAARQFAGLSLHFSAFDEGKSRGKDRCEQASRLCREIMMELGL